MFTAETGGIDLSVDKLISLFTFVLCLVLALKKKHPILIVVLSACLGLVSGIFG